MDAGRDLDANTLKRGVGAGGAQESQITAEIPDTRHMNVPVIG
jgi:hypothetical protein